MSYTGKLISLAFPDTFVKHSDEPTTKVLLALGLGKHNYIKAGHAAMVLIENKTGNAEYYDFGRYITPQGFGRVRSAVTDVELEIPFKASISYDGGLTNVEDFLLWLEANPHKTHGSGRLVASVCDYIYYESAKEFVLSIQEKGSIPYKAFGGTGSSNCSRIVTDTIIAGTDLVKIKRPLFLNKLFTPSPLGNVGKSAVGKSIYEVKNGKIQSYSGSILKENLTNYFDKSIPSSLRGNNDVVPVHLQDAHFLTGIGSSAYFVLYDALENGLYHIERYTEYGEKDFAGLFEEKTGFFTLSKPYKFVYDSNCKYCHINQGNEKIRFDLVQRIN